MKMYVIGLGNGGLEYRGTRHNVGERFARDMRGMPKNIKVLAPSLGSMNNSGNRVGPQVMRVNQAYPYLLMIAVDTIHLPVGEWGIFKPEAKELRGHKGIASVEEVLRRFEPECPRSYVAFGIGRPSVGEKLADYVLSPLSDKELKMIDAAYTEAASALIQRTEIENWEKNDD